MINDQFRRALFCYCTGGEKKQEPDDMAYIRFLMEYYMDNRGHPDSVFIFACVYTSYRRRFPEKESKRWYDFLEKLRYALASLHGLCLNHFSDDPNLKLKNLKRATDLRDPEVELAAFVQTYSQEEAIHLLKQVLEYLCKDREKKSVRKMKLLMECEAIASVLQVVYRWKGCVG